ncbi:MAG: hypothetical protein AAFY34_11670 [Pseudomonadota bacterium]
MSVRSLIVSAALLGISAQLCASAEAVDALVQEPEHCTAQDYRTMEAHLDEPSGEGSPENRLAILERFVSMCPDRIEMPSVARRAARAALDSGDPGRALALYQIAIYQGAPFDRPDRLDYITTLVETGAVDRAWTLLNQEVARWLDEVEHRGVAHIETERLRDGLLHHVTFTAVDPDFQQSDVWFAVPFNGGWPAAIVLGADQKRAALRRMVSGREAMSYEHLDLVRCRGRTTLTQNDGGLGDIDVTAIAKETARSYLRNPDVYYAYEEGQPVGTCFDPHRLFISPDPRRALSASGVKTY